MIIDKDDDLSKIVEQHQHDYIHLYCCVALWVLNGQVKYSGADWSFSTRTWGELDRRIFKLFGLLYHNLPPNHWDREIDLRWLSSPHALTLFRAKMAAEGVKAL